MDDITLIIDTERASGFTMVGIPNELVPEMIHILAERIRQIQDEGFSTRRDDECNGRDELALAASCYIAPAGSREEGDQAIPLPYHWPWAPKWWKPIPENRIRELQKGLALGAAELGRLLRNKDKDKAVFAAWDTMKQKKEDASPVIVSKPDTLDETGFVFQGVDGKIYLCRLWGNEPWFFYWSVNHIWVSLKRVSQMEIWGAYKRKLSDEAALPYQQRNPGVDFRVSTYDELKSAPSPGTDNLDKGATYNGDSKHSVEQIERALWHARKKLKDTPDSKTDSNE